MQNHKTGTIWIGQPIYTEGIVKRFGMALTTPVDPGLKLTKGTENSEYVDETHYQSVVGSLLFLSMRTRPDITCGFFKVWKSTNDCLLLQNMTGCI